MEKCIIGDVANERLYISCSGKFVMIDTKHGQELISITEEEAQQVASYYAQILKPKSPWIPVNERLPKAKGRYFVMDRWGDAGMGDAIPTYDHERGIWEMRFMNFVTHWMPIPEL